MIDMSNKEEVVKKLNELQLKKLPKMNFESFATLVNIKTKVTDLDELKEINDYLDKYYDFTGNNNKCIFTEESPRLQWGIAHGVATDSNTGLSWRCKHYLTINKQRRCFDISLQAHPDCYTIDDE